ncbi:hypothetical protein CFC21_013011 [Triticum aestivum]|uniref:DUF6598 domain-containing protein n=2 Tax=Triticum aestivum TaxID=4565 RepID=A0A3B5ZY89_WHEAT|nr:hypothetical protein CFC21_013011 [Triticum aestivum]
MPPETSLLSVSDVSLERPELSEVAWETRLALAERPCPLVVNPEQRALIEPAMKNSDKYMQEIREYWKKIDELNATLPEKDQFFTVSIQPRCPEPASFFTYYRLYALDNTNPTPLTSKRFTEPRKDYPVLTMLQIFSFRYFGDFLGDQSMLVYGFIAIRDELDCLRNYIFNCPREQAHEITPDSGTLPLISPVRGNSILDGVLLEYSLKVKSNGSDNAEMDYVLADGCIEYTDHMIVRGTTLKSRLFGKLGPVDFHYAFLSQDAIVLYDGSTDSSPAQSVFPISSVVTVQLGHELKLNFGITSKDTVRKGCARRFVPWKAASAQYQRPDVVMDGEPEPKTYSRFLTFISQKCSFDSGKVSVGDEFKAEVTVTWSTMGPY